MYRITVEEGFRAGHQVRMYDGRLEKVHEHQWRVELTVASEQLDSIGVVVDFLALRARLREVLEPLNIGRLNDVPALREQNPTAEHVACWVYAQMAGAIDAPARLEAVRVWEAEGASAIYQPSPPPGAP